MGISINTRQAYSEVDEFLELISDENRNKIPKKLREFFKEEKDINYIKGINPNISIKNQELKEETLAIIAYKQPVTRLQVEEIRGVSSDNVIRKLQVKALIKEVGRQDTPGKPILYGVTELFMDLFNLASIDELPPLEDLVEDVPENMSIFDIKYQEESIEL